MHSHQNHAQTETVTGKQLSAMIPERWDIDVRRPDGSLALKVDFLQARALARCGLVSGRVVRGYFRYLILLVPKSVAVRVLRMDPPRPGEISKPKPTELQWPPRYDNAKLGRLGGVTQMVFRPQRAA